MLYLHHEQMVDAERLVNATGNVGRKISRLIARIFRSGKFKVVFDVKAIDILDAVLFQSRLRDAVTQVARKLGAQCTLTVESHDDPRFVCLTIVPAAIPQGMRERQALLRMFLEVMRPVRATAELARDRRELDVMRRQFLDGRPADVAERDIRELGELVRGNYVNIDKAGMRTLELAAVLNPSIDERLDKGFALPALAA
jgi:SH3-like domain-containing protein